MKTLKKLEYPNINTIGKCKCGNEISMFFKENYVSIQILRQEAINWIKEIQKKSDDHWNKLDSSGFVNFPRTDNEDAYSFKIDELEIGCWHEDSSYSSIIMWIKHFFNITNEELK